MLGSQVAGPWERPVARRLCGLVLVSPGRRVSRTAACEALFPNLAPTEAARALSKALSMAHAALAPLGEAGRAVLQADRTYIWAGLDSAIEVDWEAQEEALRSALDATPGTARDDLLSRALVDEGSLLEDEPAADWAARPREHLEWARQEGRLTLARDRARGVGRARPADVVEAWEACLAHDPTSEEAACSLMRMYRAQGKPTLAEAAYRRCLSGLEQLGLRISPALDEVYGEANPLARPIGARAGVPSSPAPAWHAEERRLVSVLFAELSLVGGFQRLDPEDLRDVIGAAFVDLITEAEGLGGTVTSVSGAGLVALFGAPTSHEDDPERAVRAGFRMLSPLAGQSKLSLRVGVETGPAVVGLIGKGARVDYSAVGEVVGVAAALQSVSRPASVLVGPATRAATAGLFEWGVTEEVTTPGGGKPVTASYLERPRARPAGQVSRRGLAGSAPLVGRSAEFSLLRAALKGATTGKGGVVLITGEPGLGKTRLVQECRKLFTAWVGAASGRLPLWLEGRSASYAASSPYALYQQLLSAWVGVAPDERADLVRAALERALRAVYGGETGEEQVGLLSQVLSVGPGKAEVLSGFSPEQLQQATFKALKDLVARLVTYGPTVLVLEDLHWADPTSLHLTAEIAALTKNGPLLLLLTRRPEPDLGVSALETTLAAGTGTEFCKLELTPLAPAPARDLVRALLGRGAEDEVVTAVSHGTEGNPLFMEERLSSLIETGALKRNETRWRLAAGASGEVPEALERLVRSRVDRLERGPRDAIVAASVLGPEFGLAALRAVTDLDGELAGAVSQLCSGGLLVELRRSPEPVYRFRHALIQEATYRGLVRERRRELHTRAAWGLEELSAERLQEVAGVLGHHFAMAGEHGRAAHYLELAGDHAASGFANDEAVSSYRRAVELLGPVVGPGAPGAEGTTKSTEVRAKLVEVLLHSGRYPEARQVLEEGLSLLGPDETFWAARLQALRGRVETADHRYEDALAAFDLASNLLGPEPECLDQKSLDLWLEIQLDGKAVLYYWLNQPDKAGTILSVASPVVEARGTAQRRHSFYLYLVLQRFRLTRYRVDDEILTNCRKAVEVAREHLSDSDISLTVFGLGFALLWHGDLDEAQNELEASLAIATRTGNVVVQARCLCYLDVTALRRHDVEAVRAMAPRAMAVAELASYPEYVASAKAAQAWVAWQDGRRQDVLSLSREALALWATTVVSYSWYWICLWPLIAVHLDDGRVDEAIDSARQLLPAPQQRLPEELESAVQAAIAAHETGDTQLAHDWLVGAVELAKKLRFA